VSLASATVADEALAGRAPSVGTAATDPSLRKDGSGSGWRDAGRAVAIDRWPR
jgi:hypothetical protein